jgi:hypothetical protein
MKTETRLAQIISVVFHPLVIPTLGMLLLFHINSYISYSIPPQAKQFILLIVFINTAIAPALSVLLLKRTGLVRDLQIDDRADRIYPLLITALFFFLTYYLLRQIALPSLIYYFLIGGALLVILTLLITFRWKISIHMVSMGGLTGFLLVSMLLLKTDIYWLVLLSLLASGVVGSARLVMRAHVPLQVYAGFLMGLSVMLLLFVFLKA